MDWIRWLPVIFLTGAFIGQVVALVIQIRTFRRVFKIGRKQ